MALVVGEEGCRDELIELEGWELLWLFEGMTFAEEVIMGVVILPGGEMGGHSLLGLIVPSGHH